MAKAIPTLKIAIDFQDKGSQAVIEKLKNSLKQLERGASGAKPRIASLRKEILAQGNASVKSIANINAQSTALKALRDEAKIGGRAFNQLTKDIAKLDAQMGKAGKTTQGRRGGARQATQIAGAVISGGIFGGPEGALGAAGGAALGGVEGAFAGAAIGAQVGAFREALGASADYAAEIGKLQIALKGVTTSQEGAEASQANYSEALEAAAEATRDYNVPQGAAIRGITRLTAAVTGAGGPVADAATTFQNVTAAIKATGGSTEDVRGAITAMVQVFSKGKVSAEELSGQLGERLPGAVTLFAKANKMTLPELQKNLKAGTVGLNELMNFIRQLGVEFDDTAKTIASSNEEAGARLTVAFDNMKLGVGDALKDTGAEFQNAFGQFIEDITPRAIEASKNLSKALKPVIDNLDLLVATLVGLAAGAVIGAVVKGITAMVTAFAGAKTAIAGLTAVMALNPIFAGALAVGGIVAGIYAINKAINGQADALERVKRAGAAEGATGNEKAEAIAVTKRQISEQKRIIEANPEGAGGGARAENARTRRRQEAQKELAKLERELKDITRAPKKDKEGNIFKYNPVVDEDDSDSGSDKAEKSLARRVKQAQELESRMQKRLNLAQAESGLARFLAQQANQRTQLEEKITKLKEGGSNAAIDEATQSAQNLLVEEQRAKLQERVKKISENALKPLKSAVQAVKEQVKADTRIKELIQKGINPERAKEIARMEKIKEETLKILDANIKLLELKVASGEATKDEIAALEKFRKDREEAAEVDPEKATSGLGKAKTDFENFKETFEAGLKDMVNIGPKIANVALGAIGSVTDGLVEMAVTGKANFKEMAASILKDLAKIILKAAMAKVVASVFGINLAAKGMIVQGGAKKPYARGGIVSSPTVFPMAGGDVGLMGEAGPEAIMPLKRASNGKLGVEVAGRSAAIDAMNRYSMRNNAGGTTGFGPTGDQAAEGLEAAPQPIDVRYNVERINSVDYVTADQFQAGMRQAASQGAKQGEQQTLRRLQMSGSTRKRVGM